MRLHQMLSGAGAWPAICNGGGLFRGSGGGDSSARKFCTFFCYNQPNFKPILIEIIVIKTRHKN